MPTPEHLRRFGLVEDAIDLIMATPEDVLLRRGIANLAMSDANPVIQVKEPALLDTRAIGTGKSTEWRREQAELIEGGLRFVNLTKTNALGDESRELLCALGVEETRSYYGRSYVHKKHGPVCRYAKLAETVQKAGGDADQLCVRQGAVCEFAENCAVYKQRKARPMAWYAPHAMLPYPIEDRGPQERPFDGVVIDEDPTSTLFETKKFDASVLQDVRLTECKDTADAISVALFESVDRIKNNDLPLPHHIRELRRAVFRTKEKMAVAPNPSLEQQRKITEAAKANLAATRAAEFLAGLLQCMSVIEQETDIVHGIRAYRANDGKIRVEVGFFNELHRHYHERTVILSATAREQLLNAVYTGLKTPKVVWPRPEYAHYIRIPRAGAISSLVKNGELLSHGKKVLTMVRLLAKRHRTALVVGQIELVEALKAAGVPENVDMENFGAVEGRDEWRNVDCVFVVGRPLPPPVNFWMVAERIAKEVIPYPGEQWSKDKEAWVMGTDRALPDYSHEHPILDALLRAQCHAAVLQADRSRALHRNVDNPVEVIFMNTIDMDGVVFDEVRDLGEYSDWRAQMEIKGIVLDPTANWGKNALIAAVLSETFEDAKAVENHLRYADALPIEPTFQVKAKIKLNSARYAVPVWIDAPDVPAAQGVVEKVLPGATMISASHSLGPL